VGVTKKRDRSGIEVEGRMWKERKRRKIERGEDREGAKVFIRSVIYFEAGQVL
jgi:hypothetical protein